MSDLLVLTYLTVHHAVRSASRRAHLDERGEGVISAAIAVLVMAFIGAAMWYAFDNIFDGASKKTENQVDKIGE